MKLPFFSIGTASVGHTLGTIKGLWLASVLPFAMVLVAEFFIYGLSPLGVVELLAEPIAATSGTMNGGGVNARVSIGNADIQSVEDALSALAWLIGTSIGGLGIIVARGRNEALTILTPVKAIGKAPLFVAAVVVTYLFLSLSSIIGFGPLLLAQIWPDVVADPFQTVLIVAGAVFGVLTFLFALRVSLLPAAVALGGGFHIGRLREQTRRNGLRLFCNYLIWGLILGIGFGIASLFTSLPLNLMQSFLLGGASSIPAALIGALWHIVRLSMLMVLNGSLAIFATLAYMRLSGQVPGSPEAAQKGDEA
jgi:hypothetical protein